MKKIPSVVIGAIVLLLIILGVVAWQKSQVKTTSSTKETTIKKVDLSTQPKWVQMLKVIATKGVSANGLANMTLTVDGMPKDLVTSLSYVVQYDTSNKGTQGALSTVKINGATTFTKVIDFGTCSTKTCVRHEGVNSVEVELDFTTTSGETFTWTNTITL